VQRITVDDESYITEPNGNYFYPQVHHNQLLREPDFVDAIDGQEVLLFQPTGTDRFWDPFEARDGRQVLRDFYAHGHVERRGRERVLVGERRIEAWRIELGGVARTAWVDSDGRVVRLDLRDNPLVDATVWVRLVAPSEY